MLPYLRYTCWPDPQEFPNLPHSWPSVPVLQYQYVGLTRLVRLAARRRIPVVRAEGRVRMRRRMALAVPARMALEARATQAMALTRMMAPTTSRVPQTRRTLGPPRSGQASSLCSCRRCTQSSCGGRFGGGPRRSRCDAGGAADVDMAWRPTRRTCPFRHRRTQGCCATCATRTIATA